MSEQTPPEEREGAGAQPTEETPAVGSEATADKAPAVDAPTQAQPVPETTAVPDEPAAAEQPAAGEPAPAHTPPPAGDARSAGAGDGPARVEEPSPFDAPPWTPEDAGPARPELWLAAAFVAGLALAILLRRRAG